MATLSKRRKIVTRWIVAAILAADLGLLGYDVYRQAPTDAAQTQEENRVRAGLNRLREDVKQADSIREYLPEIRKQYDGFFTNELRPAATGYSSIVADLNSIGKEAGLRLNGLSFTQRDVGDRGVTEIQITGAVEGAYPNLVSFINGLERSNSFYVLEGLELASSTGGELRMNLKLKTYFRS